MEFKYGGIHMILCKIFMQLLQKFTEKRLHSQTYHKLIYVSLAKIFNPSFCLHSNKNLKCFERFVFAVTLNKLHLF